MNEEVSNREVVTALLTGLGDKYESMVETFDNFDDYTLQQVKFKLANREERMKQTKSDAELSGEENILLGQGMKRQRGNGGGRDGQQNKRRKEIQYWNCEKWGHYAREGRGPKSNQQ
ncbi:hypothetical protein PHPALM_1019 [Phytophthora palmivora]|uniref:Uncharacterized protein n=1 Tax=Phytophthora palmivora TaxID=4796 RepID=A0A2P4YTF8_9STRA|nr:hypothetical protein PHPALM_1019 [Phytophthora palmivora]